MPLVSYMSSHYSAHTPVQLHVMWYMSFSF